MLCSDTGYLQADRANRNKLPARFRFARRKPDTSMYKVIGSNSCALTQCCKTIHDEAKEVVLKNETWVFDHHHFFTDIPRPNIFKMMRSIWFDLAELKRKVDLNALWDIMYRLAELTPASGGSLRTLTLDHTPLATFIAREAWRPQFEALETMITTNNFEAFLKHRRVNIKVFAAHGYYMPKYWQSSKDVWQGVTRRIRLAEDYLDSLTCCFEFRHDLNIVLRFLHQLY